MKKPALNGEADRAVMITAVIPAYNEEKTVYEVVKVTMQYADEVIVVDDSSIDTTAVLESDYHKAKVAAVPIETIPCRDKPKK